MRRSAAAGRAIRDATAAAAGFLALAVIMTLPLALHFGSGGRVDSGDGQFSIWNVAWVAHALTTNPLRVFDANIFYPHRWTLAYSETNLGAGALAAPVYWLTQNPYAAHNTAFLLSFVLSGTGAYLLVRHLTGDWRGAVISGVAFAFCPYVFAHTAHIQLLMTAGLPFALLAFHRLDERPTMARGVVLGAVMAAEACFCGYYAIAGALMIGWIVLANATVRRRWTDRNYWAAVGAAAAVALAGALPFVFLYSRLESSGAFGRSLEEAADLSATWRAYLTSGAWVHRPLAAWVSAGPAADPLFPGVLPVALAAWGIGALWRSGARARSMLVLYGTVSVLAIWMSLGPRAGLYAWLYRTVPAFSIMRAPERLAVVALLAVAVLAGAGAAALVRRVRRPGLAGGLLAAAVALELAAPVRVRVAAPPPPVYGILATLPRGAVLELPVYSPRFAFARTRYMLNSTAHWMPLVDAYSDYIPQDFRDAVPDLAMFPNHAALAWLRERGVRYAVIHLDQYDAPARAALEARIREFQSRLARRYAGEDTRLYEIVEDPSVER